MKSLMTKKLYSLFLSLLLVIPLTAGTAINPLAGPSTEASRELSQDIVILSTNDVHCGVDDNIGYAGLVLYKKQMLAQTPNVTLVDAGDAIQGAPMGTLSDGEYLIDIMNQVGYDVAVPGNHEFDYGMDRFLELSQKLECGYYSSNFISLASGSPVFSPYKLISYGETSVAYVGVCTPESFTKSTPAYFQDAEGNYIYGFSEDESGQKLYAQVQSSVDSARMAGADYVVLVGHLGKNGVSEKWSSDSVIRNTTGIDAVIDGHSHETISGDVVQSKDGKAVTVMQTGTKLNAIGKMTIKQDGTITTELVNSVPFEEIGTSYQVQKGDTLNRIAKRKLGSYDRWQELYKANKSSIKNPDRLTPGMTLRLPGGSAPDEKGRAVDTDTARFIQNIQKQYEELLTVVLGRTDYNLTTLNQATGQRAVRNAETNLGDLTADAYRYVLGADIGFSNGGGIRADITIGNVTYQDTLAVFPYGNMGCVAEVTGQQIKDALEMGVRKYPDENGAFLHVSGLTYTLNGSLPSNVQVDDKGNFVKVNGAYRAENIMVNEAALDIKRIYKVASHNYMLKSGGDGFAMFKGCRIIKDEVITDVDLLSTYINEQLGGTVGDDYADPVGQGRIKIVKSH